MGIHLLYCVHGGKRIASNDVVENVFTSIARDARFHVFQKRAHILSLSSL
jgi:hypothetical protein